MATIFSYLNLSILIYFALLATGYTLFLLATFPEMIKKFKETAYGNIAWLINRDNLLPITVVIPAYNEENRILNALYSILQSDYKNVNIIVVNDGSKDNTMALLQKEFSLYEVPLVIKQTIETSKLLHQYKSKRFENLTVLDKEHSLANCASDAINVGLNACRTPVMLTVDSDTVLEPTALTRILFSFLSQPHCVAVGGSVYVINDNRLEHGKLLEKELPKKFIPAIQGLEYLRSFLYGRSGWNILGGALCYSGAFTLFETQALYEVGGYDAKNYSYDVDIIMKLHQQMQQKGYPHRLYYTPNAFAWTEVPSTLKSFWRQRNHWQRGMLRSVGAHKGMFFNPKFGIVGLLGFPVYVIFEVYGPVVEFTAYVLFVIGLFLGIVPLNVVIWFIILAWGYISLLSIATYFLNTITFNRFRKIQDAVRIVWLAFIEMFGFRQYRAMCCFFSTFQYFINRLLGKDL